MTIAGKHQIGEVADEVGLSIRTIRHYDEMGVVEPSGRSDGGFRLYTDADVDRLRLVKHLRPLKFSLEEIQELLAILDSGRWGARRAERLEWFVETAAARCETLRAQLHAAEQVAGELHAALEARTVAPR
ncbi:MAG: MerR family transcriptional regulator [Ilumatobacteraceae bacterium]